MVFFDFFLKRSWCLYRGLTFVGGTRANFLNLLVSRGRTLGKLDIWHDDGVDLNPR